MADNRVHGSPATLAPYLARARDHLERARSQLDVGMTVNGYASEPSLTAAYRIIDVALHLVRVAQETADPEGAPSLNLLTDVASRIDPSLHGPRCECGHVRLDHWGDCVYPGCPCGKYIRQEATD